MDADRVRAYLQVACAGLGFDIGEVWWMSNDSGTSTVAAIEDRSGNESDSSGEETFSNLIQSKNAVVDRKKTPKKRFLQLYTSKAYCDQRSKLVQPHDNENDSEGGSGGGDSYPPNGGGDGATSPNKSSRHLMRRSSSVASLELDEEHVLSPRIVEAVTRSTQVVWANCQKSEGLLGRSDIKLQTAIGMPVGLDESGNVWVVVMFSPKNVESSSDAMDYLQYISRSAASASIPCLLPVVGEWGGGGDMPPPTTKMICDGIADDRQHHQHHLVSIKPKTKQPDHTQELGDGVTAKFVSFNITDDDDDYNDRKESSQYNDDHDNRRRRTPQNDLRNAPKDDWGIPILPKSDNELYNLFASNNNTGQLATANSNTLSNFKRQHTLSLGSAFDDVIENALTDAFDDASYGIWNTIMDSVEPVCDDSNQTPTIDNSGKSKKSEEPVAVEMHLIQERLEEFATAFLGMSVFDVADAWTAPSSSIDSSNNGDGDPTLNCLFTVAATNSNPEINELMDLSWDASIGTFDGAVGRAFSSGYPVWSSVKELIYDNIRREALKKCKIETAFAIPIFSSGDVSPSCVLCFYSLLPAESVPFVLNFVQKAVRLLWSGLDLVVNPHESVGNLWKGVGPADLGEMAADVEMQKAFIGKKRPRGLSFQEIESDRFRSMSILTDVDYLSDVLASPAILPNNSVDIPVVSLAPTPAVAAPLVATQPGPLPSAPQFLYLDSDNDGHWAVQQAVRSVEETLWNGSNGVHEGSLRPENRFINVGAPQQQQLQQPHHHHHHQQQQLSLLSPQLIQQQQPPQQQEQPHQYQLNHVIYDNVITQQKQQPPHMTMTYLPAGVHNDDLSVIQANLMEFNAMAKMHCYDNSNINQSLSATSNNAAATEVAKQLNIDAYRNGVYNNSYEGPHFGKQTMPNHPSRNVNDTAVNINHGSIVSSPLLTGPQHNMFCTSVAQPITAQSMDPSLFDIDQHSCRIEGCSDLAVSKRPYCARHCGNRQCEKEGCTKCAQGATRFCIAHGGGRRCTYLGCDKGARDKYFCAAHGGGKRCKLDGCHKSAVGGSLYCTGHGGGKRCSVMGCDKSAQSSTKFCVKHGGGKKCSFEGCKKVARGRTLFCAAHGGGIRCKLAGCNRVAIGKAQLCRSHGGGVDSHLDLDAAGI